MPRDYFKRSTGSQSVSGTVITDIQASLNAVSIFDITVDGAFGQQTEEALTAFQTTHALPVSGTVSDTTWTALIHSNEPPIYERCLQVTASFEGTGFTLIEGDFDGAGLTWGIIGFTLINGELSELLGEISTRLPASLTQAFGHDAATLMQNIGPASSAATRAAFATSVSGPAPQYRVAEPWRSGFASLGAQREVQRLQIERARTEYWTAIALRDAADLGLTEELDLLLLFDVAVQNGGMRSKGRLKSAQSKITSGMAAVDKRRAIAQVVADTIKGKFKGDVLARKNTIAVGDGTVHGAKYDLASWGLADGFVPKAV